MTAAEKAVVIGRQAVLPQRINPAMTSAIPSAMPTRGMLSSSVVSAALRGEGQAPPVGRAHAVPGLDGKVSVQAAKSAYGTANHAAAQPNVARKWRSSSTTSTGRAACLVT